LSAEGESSKRIEIQDFHILVPFLARTPLLAARTFLIEETTSQVGLNIYEEINNFYKNKTFLSRTIDYVRIFDNGIKAFDYFTSKNFHYSMKNSLRILNSLSPEDAATYNYDVKYCDWREYMESQIKGIRYFFYKESKETTYYHRMMWFCMGVVQFFWYVVGFYVLQIILSYAMDTPIAIIIATIVVLFVKWI
jgi:hypothetical protein